MQGVIQKDHEDMLNLKEQANQKFEQLKEEYEQRERDLNEEHKKYVSSTYLIYWHYNFLFFSRLLLLLFFILLIFLITIIELYLKRQRCLMN